MACTPMIPLMIRLDKLGSLSESAVVLTKRLEDYKQDAGKVWRTVAPGTVYWSQDSLPIS